MKLSFVYISLFVLSISFLIASDVLQGLKLWTAIHIIKEGFSVVSTTEKSLIFITFLWPLLSPLVDFMKRKNKYGGKSN
jgi:hypothetical protein